MCPDGIAPEQGCFESVLHEYKFKGARPGGSDVATVSKSCMAWSTLPMDPALLPALPPNSASRWQWRRLRLPVLTSGVATIAPVTDVLYVHHPIVTVGKSRS